MANNVLLESDNFASGSLAAGWAAVSGQVLPVVVAGSPNVVECPSPGVGGYALWTGLSWPKNQTSEVTATVIAEGGTFLVLFLRFQAGAYSGYQVNINNSTCSAYSYTAGVATQVGSTVSGLTFAANDVWTASIAGSCISVYQNGKRIFVNSDTTWTSGVPGFAVLSGTVSHSKVFSWRGYNLVQQDGVWQKQGIIIPALSTDTLTGGIGAWINSAILHEGSAQVLSGTVFKMWFNAGNNIGYAESLDGINWSRYASAVITGYTVPMIMKVGATYYLYAQLGTGGNTGNFHAFTSTDGINWTNQGDTGIGTGGAGTWDHVFVYSLQPVAIIAGTWYALYTGGDNSVAQLLGSLGMATSSDGLAWTKYGSNPLIANFWNSQAITNVGGIWYMWGEVNSPGRGEASAPGLDPTETVRMQSTDLIHWTNPVHSLHNSQPHESLNTNTGQCFPNAIINVGGKAHLYYTADPSDAPTPHVYQIGVAIGAAPVSSIIGQNEDAAQTIATDAFTSGAGDLSANWTLPTGGTKLKIVSGPYVEPTATSTVCQAVYTAASFAVNQYSEITLQALTGTLAQSLIWPTVLSSVSALTNYEGRVASPTATSDAAAAIYKRVAGTPTQIGPTATVEPQVGDVWRLSVVTGSDGFPVLSLSQNGFLVLQVQDYGTPITSGNPGIQAYSSVAIADAQISLWAGGNANVTPHYRGGGMVLSGSGGVVDDEEDDF